ncbi:MAG: adenylosuccinate synthase [Spirochaetia bacterium]
MNLVVIGAQWGDEGKGKIVDYFAKDADLIVRFSGGANAGHTIVTEDTTYKLHLIPSGIIYPGKQVILGLGMVIDPEALFFELETLTKQGIDWEGRVFIAERAHIVLPEYRKRDKAREKKRNTPIGTTGRGIGITYAMKAHREGVRMCDIFDEALFSQLDVGDREFLEKYKEKIRPMLINTAQFIKSANKGHVLLEGAQGTLLDLDLGTYPYVSSGMSSAAGAAVGGAIGPRNIHKVLGVFKAYSTRVGNGPFPSEFSPETDGELEEYIRQTGREYGVTTGRPRRCGYLDLVALKHACITNSVDALVLTHLDVYDEMEEVKLCVAYDNEGSNIIEFPALISQLEKMKPITKRFPGWNRSLKDCKSFDELPKEAKEYIRFIEDYVETPIEIISVGYERKQTIVRESPWKKS